LAVSFESDPNKQVKMEKLIVLLHDDINGFGGLLFGDSLTLEFPSKSVLLYGCLLLQKGGNVIFMI